jgi:hypothetical protein
VPERFDIVNSSLSMLVDCWMGELPADAVETGRRRGFDADHAYWHIIVVLIMSSLSYNCGGMQYIYCFGMYTCIKTE